MPSRCPRAIAFSRAAVRLAPACLVMHVHGTIDPVFQATANGTKTFLIEEAIAMNPSVKGTLLVVDDEPLKRATLDIDLTAAGYRVIQAPDALTALEYLAEQTVDVVIADLRMPEMDGLQLLERVKAASPRTHVILMTAFGSVDTAVEAMKHGAHDYLAKPFSSAALVSRLDRLLANGHSPDQPDNGSAGGSATPAASDRLSSAEPGGETLCAGSLKLTEAVAGVERSLIDAALRRAAGNQAKAAVFLGIPRTTLRDKMAKYGFVGETNRSPNQ